MFDEVIFDLETKSFFVEDGKFDPSRFGVSVVSLYSRKLNDAFDELEGKMYSFWEEEFASMWPIFERADRIIGFNSLGFDVPALKPYAPASFSKLPHFDILDEIKKNAGHKTSLHKIAKATLGIQKTDTSENAVLYWEKHDPKSLELLKKYCQDDVEITKKVYDFALKNKKLLFTDYWNNPREVALDFAYPELAPKIPQASLF
jgi:DEAD/DEAH box helicase domain-containing protein